MRTCLYPAHHNLPKMSHIRDNDTSVIIVLELYLHFIKWDWFKVQSLLISTEQQNKSCLSEEESCVSDSRTLICCLHREKLSCLSCRICGELTVATKAAPHPAHPHWW